MEVKVGDLNALKIPIIILRLILEYVKYYFLTASVLFAVAVIFFIIINLNPDYSFGFLNYFTFLFNEPQNGVYHGGVKEIMQIFAIFSFVFMIIIKTSKFIIKKLFSIDINISFKNKIIASFIIITPTYLFACLITLSNKELDRWFIILFIIFYVINLIAIILYIGIDFLIEKVSKFQASIDNENQIYNLQEKEDK